MCNKIGYETRSELRKHFKETFARNSKSSRGQARKKHSLRPYKCPRCGLWHMTSLAKSVIKQRYKDKR